MFSENTKKKLSSTKMPRALRARQALFAELSLPIFAEHVNFALILAPYFGVHIQHKIRKSDCMCLVLRAVAVLRRQATAAFLAEPLRSSLSQL